MVLFGNKPQTAQQKAQRAKTSLMIRAVALFYIIVFVIVPLINAGPEDAEGIDPTLRYATIAFFIIATAAITVTSVLEYIRNNKAGRYKAEAYTDDEGVAGVSVSTADRTGEDGEEYGDEEEDDEEDDDEEED